MGQAISFLMRVAFQGRAKSKGKRNKKYCTKIYDIVKLEHMVMYM